MGQRSRIGRCGSLVVVLAAVVLTGCGGGQSEVTQGRFTIYVHGDSLLPRGGDDALVTGELIVRDGCVLLGDDVARASPVVWPSGTSIADDDPLTLRLPSGDRLSIGETVRGGGGSHDAASDRVEADIDDACLRGSAEVLVFNPDEELTVG